MTPPHPCPMPLLPKNISVTYSNSPEREPDGPPPCQWIRCFLVKFSPFLEEVLAKAGGKREILQPATHTSETESWNSSLRRVCEHSIQPISMSGLELEHQFTKSGLQPRHCQGVYKVKAISIVFLRHHLPLFYPVGLCSDGAETMQGKTVGAFSMNQGSGTNS